ncbi:MAG: YkgJ family cysteine cluster protein [Thermomonas sp.]
MPDRRDTTPSADADSPRCDRCDAVCCRLTVVLMPEDRIPARFTTRNSHGVEVMARDEEGWCVAIDSARMCCSIYEQRPAICRKFAMGGPACREVRADHADRLARHIPLQMY